MTRIAPVRIVSKTRNKSRPLRWHLPGRSISLETQIHIALYSSRCQRACVVLLAAQGRRRPRRQPSHPHQTQSCAPFHIVFGQLTSSPKTAKVVKPLHQLTFFCWSLGPVCVLLGGSLALSDRDGYRCLQSVSGR